MIPQPSREWSYGNHLSNANTSAFASYDVRGAVDVYRASNRDTAAKAALESLLMPRLRMGKSVGCLRMGRC